MPASRSRSGPARVSFVTAGDAPDRVRDETDPAFEVPVSPVARKLLSFRSLEPVGPRACGL